MITIIDYKSGNLKSISNGFKKIGEELGIGMDSALLIGAEIRENTEGEYV